MYSSPDRIQSINELNSLKLFSKLVKYWSTPHEFEPSTSAAITWRPVRHTGEGGSPRPLHLQTSRKRESIPFLQGGRLKSAGSSVARAEQGGGKAAFDRAREVLREGTDLISRRQKLIKFADRSEAGWAVVDEYVDDNLADDSEDEKRMERAKRMARDLKSIY